MVCVIVSFSGVYLLPPPLTLLTASTSFEKKTVIIFHDNCVAFDDFEVTYCS